MNHVASRHMHERCFRRVVVQSNIYTRAAFAPIAVMIVEVVADRLSCSALGPCPVRRPRRPIALLDQEVRFLD